MDAEEVRLAVVIPERETVSESFLVSHIEGLFRDPEVIWGSPRPLYSDSGESVLGGVLAVTATGLGRLLRMGTQRAQGSIGQRLPDAVYSRLMARFLRRAGVEVVLAEYGPTAAAIMRACTISQTPLVVHFHGYDAYRKETLTEMRGPYQRLFDIACRVVAVSNHMLEQLVKLGCPAEKLVCNPCGVNVGQFEGARPAEAEPLFLALGRFVEKKGPLLTLRAFAQVEKEEPRARLVMIGEGPLRDRCVDFARELGVGPKVDFPGAVEHAEVAAWMLRARCFVQHSLRADDGDSEGTPVAVLEASSCGLPVVSTRHTGIVDAVVDSKGGFLVEEGDVDGMARRMLRLAREPELAQEMGAVAREHVQARYSSQRSLGRLRSVVLDAARRDRREG